ncbi:hypothetical protein SDC9_149148 [bioreactor metagenome]|uniref:Uncharacterized protein n=1 Tax=bioreactor metagenome TaxID=1076179 RepID=A0A645EIU0_9ZZZZ
MFTDSDNQPLPDAQQISARRSKGKRFFNNEWRDMLQAAIYSHANGTDNVIVNLCCENNILAIRSNPYIFMAQRGYTEPAIDPTELFEEEYLDDEDL